jgi:hypothetical protein
MVPLFYIDNKGKMAGLNAGLIALINQTLRTNFTIKRHVSWSAACEKADSLGATFSIIK